MKMIQKMLITEPKLISMVCLLMEEGLLYTTVYQALRISIICVTLIWWGWLHETTIRVCIDVIKKFYMYNSFCIIVKMYMYAYW